MIGPDWGRCDPNNPKNRRRRVSVLVEDSGTSILVDASPDLREQLIDARVKRLDAVLLTHDHADHTHGIDDLRGINYLMNGPVDIYGAPDTIRTVKSRFGYAFDHDGTTGPWYRPCFRSRQIDGQFRVGAVSVEPFEQIHGRTTTLGFRFGRFAYSTDVNDLNTSSLEILAGIEVWVVDCARYKPSPGHASLRQVLNWVAVLKPRQTLLTHLSAEMDYEELQAQLPEGIAPAFDGMLLTIDNDMSINNRAMDTP